MMNMVQYCSHCQENVVTVATVHLQMGFYGAQIILRTYQVSFYVP